MMSEETDHKGTGEIASVGNAIWVEWKLLDYFSLPKDKGFYIESPLFHFLNAVWFLRMYPNGKTERHSADHMALYLLRETSSAYDSDVYYEFVIKRHDKTAYKAWSSTAKFTNGMGYGVYNFVRSSEMFQDKAAFSLDGSITIFCIIATNCNEELNATSRMGLPEGKDENHEKIDKDSEETEDLREPVVNISGVNRLAMNLKDLLINEEEWDVIVKVKDREFKAHKAILMARSTVFAAMFKHNMAEKNSGVVDVTDCEPDVFQDFLLYLYTGNVENLTTQNVFDLYCAADKYNVEDLKNECVNCMIATLSVETVCDVIILSLRYDESVLLKEASLFFFKNFKKVVVTLKWQNFLKENPTAANELLVKFSDYYETNT